MRATGVIAGAAVTAALLLTGCFTGVESTPRIKAPSGSPAHALRAEDTLLAGVRPEPPRLWRPGKRWHVTDSRLALLLVPADGRSLPADPRGMALTLVSLADQPSITGEPEGVLLMALGPDSRSVKLPLGMTRDRFLEADAWPLHFAIEESMVTRADSLLRGRRLWTTAHTWRDADDNPVAGRLYEPVTVDSVTFGTEQHPLRIAFHALAPDSLAGSFFVDPQAAPAARSRSFASLLALADPWLGWPQIAADRRPLIARGLTAEGMTRQEVRLALGNPASIQRSGTTSTIMRERWIYDNGHSLTFEDGLLITTP